jgi:uncharacterized membrane protein (Fun14 family)
MIIESLVPTITSIGGGFLVGIVVGYFVKKLLKILIFLAGGIVGLLLFLHLQKIISVDQKRLEASLTLFLTTLSPSFENITQTGDISSLGIPLTASMTAGFTLALAKL